LETVTFTSSVAVWPPPATLSRTVTAKFNTRLTEGKTSQVFCVCPPKIVAILGKNLEGFDVPSTERNTGPDVLNVVGNAVEA
jgi:hypothetical protein